MTQKPHFIDRIIKCPACKAKQRLRYPDPKQYQASERESDLHVLTYSWSVDNAEHILPHHYAIWQCTACLFSDMAEVVEKPERSFKEYYLRSAFQALTEDKVKIFQETRKLVDESFLDPNGAAALHLAGLAIAMLPDDEKKDYSRLGKLALRLAWLYRERAGAVGQSVPVPKSLDELREVVEELDRQVVGTAEVLDRARVAAEARAAELGPMEDEEDEANEHPYTAVTTSMADKLAEMQTLLTLVQSAILQDRRGKLGSTDKAVGSLTEMSRTMRGVVPEFPTTERQCLDLAVKAFEHAYYNERTNHSIEESMTMLGLMIDLGIRVGQHEQALSYVHEVYKAGMAHKQDLRKRIAEAKSKRKLRAHDELMLNRKIAVVTMAIQQAGESRRELIDILIEKHDEVITRVLEETKGQKTKERAKALEAAELPLDVITGLKLRKMLA